MNCLKTCHWFNVKLACNAIFSWISKKPVWFLCEFGLLCNSLWIAEKPAFGFNVNLACYAIFSWIAEKPVFGLYKYVNLACCAIFCELLKDLLWFLHIPMWIWLVVQFFVNCWKTSSLVFIWIWPGLLCNFIMNCWKTC